MSRNSNAFSDLPSASAIPPTVLELLGKPPVLSSEDPKEYEQIRAHVAAAIAPTDMLGWLNVDAYCSIVWEMRRYRKVKASMIDFMRKDALQQILELTFEEGEEEDSDELLKTWYKDSAGKSEVLEVLAPYGLDEDTITARASALALQQTTVIDVHLERLDRRAAAALREDEHRQVYLSWLSAQTPGNLIEGPVEEIALSPAKKRDRRDRQEKGKDAPHDDHRQEIESQPNQLLL